MSAEANHPKPQAADEPLPKAGTATAPVLLIALAAFLGFFGMVYVGKYGGNFDAHAYPPYLSTNETAMDWPEEHPDPMLKLGKQVYQNCAACHQGNGMGLAGQFPNLAGSDWVNNKSPNRIIRIVLNGLQGPLVVNGQPFSTSAAMLAWKANLTDEQIAAVLTYVRSSANKDFQTHNDAPPVTVDEVKAIRAKIASKDGYFSPDELMKLGDKD